MLFLWDDGGMLFSLMEVLLGLLEMLFSLVEVLLSNQKKLLSRVSVARLSESIV